MAQEREERRLAAILAADMVGYSRLMEADERGTIARQKAHRSELIDPEIAAHNGRIVKTTGDGLLVEFASVVDATECAVAIQRGMAEREAEVPEDHRVRYRIGINLGDIVIDGDDIFGDGVNIAARLEGLAEPGGIRVSGAAHEQLKAKVDVGYEDLGEQRVKNIAQPIRVYRVLLDPGAAGRVAVAARTRLRRWSRPAAGATGVMAVLLAAGYFGMFPIRPPAPEIEPASVERMAFPLPDKPSIAVLPFTNLSGDPEQEYFADGITDDLITDLSRISGLFVIARNTAFAYKGKTVPVRQVAEDLGVRYLLQGSVRRAGNQVRINAQLIDTMTGGHLWAQRYDRKLDDIFALQDTISGQVVQALELRLTKNDRDRRSTQPRTEDLKAYDLVLRARKLMTRFDHNAADQARDLLDRAIELDAGYAEAHSLLGLYYFDQWRLWGENRVDNLSRARNLAETAIKLSPMDPAPHALLAQIHQFDRKFDAANTQADAALALEPNDAVTLANLGSMLRYAHRAEQAAKVVGRAIRLDPFHPPNYLEWLGDAYFLLGRLSDCAETVERGIALEPDYVALHVVAAKCYAALDDGKRAREAGSEVLRNNPGFTLRAFAAYVPFSDRRDLKQNIEMLRKAGLPE